MRVPNTAAAAVVLCLAAPVAAVEVTVQNDSLSDFGAAVVVSGFAANEKASAWLTSPCAGNVRAAQVFWRSGFPTGGQTFGRRIEIARAGTFPTPGPVQQSIEGPVMTDGDFINEFRFLDENQTIPVNVPVAQDETFVVSFEFDAAPPAIGPSLVRDIDGCQAGRNGLLADLGGFFFWASSCDLGLSGDWVIRAVVDCGVAPSTADLAVTLAPGNPFFVPGGPVTYTIVATNNGPSAANASSVTDTFPSTLLNVSWTCSATGGAACPVPAGSGNIVAVVNLPVGGSVTFQVSAIADPGAAGPIANSVGVFPPGGTTDPNTLNNLASTTIDLQADPVFGDGFE